MLEITVILDIDVRIDLSSIITETMEVMQEGTMAEASILDTLVVTTLGPRRQHPKANRVPNRWWLHTHHQCVNRQFCPARQIYSRLAPRQYLWRPMLSQRHGPSPLKRLTRPFVFVAVSQVIWQRTAPPFFAFIAREQHI
jgi:hypothetical protein